VSSHRAATLRRHAWRPARQRVASLDMNQPLPRRLNVAATPEVETGVYADFVRVWHLPSSFVLDFSVHTNPPQIAEVDGQKVINLPARMVSRVRIPPSQ